MSDRPGFGAALDTFWSRPVDRLFEALRSGPTGLDTDEARARLAKVGRNVLAARPRAGLARLFFRQLANPLVLILAVAAAVAALVGEPVQSVIVLAVLLGSAVVTLFQEYRGTKAIEELQALLVLKTTVLRGGESREIPAEEVVPGDIVVLSAGSLIPADGVVVEARDLFVNQSVLTGESFPVEKIPGTVSSSASLAERTNVALMGTSIRSGTGLMMVVLTGPNTSYGDISRRLTLRAPETEFERGIRHFGHLVAQVIVLLVLFVFAANVFLDRPPVEALLFAIALAVGMSPELLPAIVSVTLAKGAREMAKGGVIVRQLPAIENFGSMDVLCCDKTGTLTEGRVRLEGAVDPTGKASEEVLRRARENAFFQTGIRNPLDEAIVAEVPGDLGKAGNVRKVDEIPYDFVRRRITVVVEDESGTWLVTKGAVTQTLASCARIDGVAGPVGDGERAALENRVAEWGEQGYRVLAVAQKEVERRERYGPQDEKDLTLIGLLLFEDRAKEGIKTVLDELRSLGVGVKIITGDSRHAARHVAHSVGLDASRLLTGTALEQTRDEALWRLAEDTAVFAEVDPHQKERIIAALRKTGHVVGFLGDGINDAPALRAADVGISVETAADVAREAADLVLLRPDLEVLRQGILKGRTTFANTIKYIHITTSANFGNMVSMAAASLFLPFLPLLAGQILLNNFLSDIPAVALAGDRVDEAWIRRPRRWEIRPIRRFMITFGLVSTVFDLLTFAILLLVFSAGAELFRTGWWVLSLMTELVVLFVARTRGPFFRSRPSKGLVWSSLATAVVALVLPFTPVGALFSFVPLPPPIVLTVLLLTLGYAVATEATKRRFYSLMDSTAGWATALSLPASRSK